MSYLVYCIYYTIWCISIIIIKLCQNILLIQGYTPLHISFRENVPIFVELIFTVSKDEEYWENIFKQTNKQVFYDIYLYACTQVLH